MLPEADRARREKLLRKALPTSVISYSESIGAGYASTANAEIAIAINDPNATLDALRIGRHARVAIEALSADGQQFDYYRVIIIGYEYEGRQGDSYPVGIITWSNDALQGNVIGNYEYRSLIASAQTIELDALGSKLFKMACENKLGRSVCKKAN